MNTALQPIESEDNNNVLSKFLRLHDVPCPRCAGSLVNCERDRCPHCQAGLMLHVDSTTRHGGAFLAGVVLLAGSAGFCGVLLLYFTTFLVMNANANSGQFWATAWQLRQFTAPVLIGSVVSVIALLGWLRIGAWLSRRPSGARQMLAAAAALVPLICLALVVIGASV